MKLTIANLLCALVFGCPTIAQELPKLKSHQRDGYVDISVLNRQVDRNTAEIRRLKDQLKDLKKPTLTSKSNTSPSPPNLIQSATASINPTYYWQSQALCSCQQPVLFGVPAHPPTYSGWSYSLPMRRPNGSVPIPLSTFSNVAAPFGGAESIVVQMSEPTTTQPPKLQNSLQRQPKSNSRQPRCRIVNGRKSCN